MTLTASPVPWSGGDTLGGFVLLHTTVAGTWQRSADTGLTWTAVRNGVAATEQVVYDYEAPFYTDLLYRLLVAGVEAERTGPVLLTSPTPWLGNVLVPSLGMPVRIVRATGLTRPTRTAVHAVIGRASPVTVSDVLGLRRGTLELQTTLAERDALTRVLAPGSVLLLRTTRPDRLVPTMYLTAVGAVSDDPLTTGVHTLRVRSVDFVEVDRPEGATTVVPAAVRTWQEVLDLGTWADVLAQGTWLDVLVEQVGG